MIQTHIQQNYKPNLKSLTTTLKESDDDRLSNLTTRPTDAFVIEKYRGTGASTELAEHVPEQQ
jgi:hypothetical protein